jgi:hypothetical protein
MLRFTTLAPKPELFCQLTGFTVAQFLALVPAFKEAEAFLREQELAVQRKSPRKRRPGGGRKPLLAQPEDRLLFILVYFKIYPIQDVQAFLFGISQAQAWEWIHRLTPALNMALGVEQQLPSRQPAELSRVLRQCRGLEFIIDGTERPIQRPKAKARQKRYYSGKKKRHTVKNLVITDRRTKRILGLSPTVEGKVNDKRIADEGNYRFPTGSILWKDTGFQGYQPANTHCLQPKKKPPKGELTDDEKATNRRISRVRVRVEHAIGGAKVFRIARDVFRNRRENYVDVVFETACGLHNLRIRSRMRNVARKAA